MYSHKWTATNVDYDKASGRVSHVHYMLESTNPISMVQRAYGTVKLTGDSSIPLKSVTKELACSWAKREMGSDVVRQKEWSNEILLDTQATTGDVAPWIA